MDKLKIAINNILLKLTGYTITKLDMSGYTFRNDLYIEVTTKYSHLIHGKILDIGSSPGSWAKETFGENNEVTTFDKTGDVDVHGDLLSMAFPDNTFDCIFCFETIEHVQDPFKAVAEIYRVLKPNGIFIGSTPFMYELHGEDYGDYWRITRQAWHFLLKDFKAVEVYWMGRKELTPHHYFFKGIK